jgi:hypothetical protein
LSEDDVEEVKDSEHSFAAADILPRKVQSPTAPTTKKKKKKK